MEKSNLRLFSNVYPLKGRWKKGWQEFVAKIWDDKAMQELKVAERKKELTLTDYQEELYRCTIQCPELPDGERPWGWIEQGRVGCRCRNEGCPRFRECRAREGELSPKEREIWAGGNQDGLASFAQVWEQNRTHVVVSRGTGEVDLISVFADGEYDAVNNNPGRPFDPKIASGYPDDEEYE